MDCVFNYVIVFPNIAIKLMKYLLTYLPASVRHGNSVKKRELQDNDTVKSKLKI